MSTIKSIWKNTFLGKLLSSDPLFGRVLLVLLFVYVCIHIFRLEMYPMYMFAMFSKQETPRELYHVYKLYDQDKQIDLKDWDFRKYTVFMNTIGQYDDILNNNMSHPEAEAIDKFIKRLHLNDTGVKSAMKSTFEFSNPVLKQQVGLWISDKLNLKPQNLRIEKESYNWDQSTPTFTDKVVLYELD